MSNQQTPAKNRAPLEIRLKRQIATAGPISVAAYMTHCLSDPEYGYYTSQTPIGALGDFITAPEVSQMFGELIAIWILSAWQQSGSPTPFHLVELGPGRGTLMRDMLNALSAHHKAFAALHVHLVDISASLKPDQEKALSPFPTPVQWHQTIDTLPNAPLYMVANEFFDCLPLHQWIMHQGKWYERVVGLDEKGELAFGLGPVRDFADPAEKSGEEKPQEGTIKESCPSGEAIIATIAERLAQQGGAGLFIDYGHIHSGHGDTFQAMRNHAFANPLSAPGLQDLTAHVDFDRLLQSARQAVEGSHCAGTPSPVAIPSPSTQGEFLLSMGLLERAGQLGYGKSHAEQEALRDAVERLAAPDQMGDLFKCLAILPTGAILPPFTKG